MFPSLAKKEKEEKEKGGNNRLGPSELRAHERGKKKRSPPETRKKKKEVREAGQTAQSPIESLKSSSVIPAPLSVLLHYVFKESASITIPMKKRKRKAQVSPSGRCPVGYLEQSPALPVLMGIPMGEKRNRGRGVLRIRWTTTLAILPH